MFSQVHSKVQWQTDVNLWKLRIPEGCKPSSICVECYSRLRGSKEESRAKSLKKMMH